MYDSCLNKHKRVNGGGGKILFPVYKAPLFGRLHKCYYIQPHTSAAGQAGFIEMWGETNLNYGITAQSQLWGK